MNESTKNIGVICEYNPFHNGHKYLLDTASERGAHGIIAVMGGNFLQRGECAVMDKYARAKAAVLGGADLVLELPTVYAVSSAQSFANAAVEILAKCGAADELCFGTEGADIQELCAAREVTENPTVLARCKEYAKEGYSHPRAMQAAVSEMGAEYENTARLLSTPNNTLAVEYLRALAKYGDSMAAKAVARRGTYHGSAQTRGKYASASKIRQMILEGDISYTDYVPAATADIIKEQTAKGLCPTSFASGERAVLYTLRNMTPRDFVALPDVTEGMENRLYRAVRGSTTIEEVISTVKCKRYTHTRICRVITCAYLGITKEMCADEPQYIRVLAFGGRGVDILRRIKKATALPIVMFPAKDIKKLSKTGARQLETDLRASDLYALLTPKVCACGNDYYQGAMRIER